MPVSEKCSTLGCPNRSTHVLEYDAENPMPGTPARVHDFVCEECGNSYMNTNHVKRQRPALARDGAAPSAVPPRIRVRVQHDSEPDAYPRDSDWWEDEDAAAIRAGRLVPYVIEIIDGAGEVITDCPNRLAGPRFEGVYLRPSDILDAWLEYYAADHWTPYFGIEPGDLVIHQGTVLTVVNYEQVDHEYGEIGRNTGFLVCQPTNESTHRLIWIEKAARVMEITA
ncbi:hypothetical protein [Streptomyces niveus]|uniref:hypothetical protein n=1 Tax=Streptomyces niveus TaxID=193462 RepID=UPI00342CD594